MASKSPTSVQSFSIIRDHLESFRNVKGSSTNTNVVLQLRRLDMRGTTVIISCPSFEYFWLASIQRRMELQLPGEKLAY